MFGQVLLLQTEKGEVWQIAEHGLKPAVFGQDFAHARIVKLVHIKSEHGDVLRRAWPTAYKHKLRFLDTYDHADLGKLDQKIGSPQMTIGEPPLIPYQVDLPEIEPGEKKSKVKSGKRQAGKRAIKPAKS